MADALLAPPKSQVVQHKDLGKLELYSFDTAPDPAEAIYFVSGSGCASLRFFLKDYFADLPGSYRIYALQKEGVGAMASGGSCPRAFDETNTADALIARNIAALEAAQDQFGGQFTAIIGVSEGGVVAAPLAEANPEVANLVIIGAGGMTFREELALLEQESGGGERLAKALADVKSSPRSLEARFMGMPYRYLSSMLDFDPLPHLLAAEQRVLLIHGEADRSVPLASARQAFEALSEAPDRDISLEIVEGANHILEGPQGDAKPAIMARLPAWFVGQSWSAPSPQ